MKCPELVFFESCAKTAREMPMQVSIQFLRGMIQSCHDSEALEHVRKLYSCLTQTDAQLELIAKGEIQLSFEPLTFTASKKEKK